ncbi:two-component system response regulator [Candidatus Aerophobetes bacterium]|uniref:Two-component system response regulator n=1 Tax=Aerophobetes bacterium TaxID=2030807 RepID=A0A2A4YD74_UNCAE|nr:MAG: two-component system response regulator [Candidatus Aerophobetes bacterium]
MGKKILVVDDDPDIVKVFSFRLKQAGYEVVVANDGITAFEKIISEKPNLILLDVQIPGKDGITIVNEMQNNPEIKDIPVILITGKVDLEKGGLPKTAKIDYVVKPCDFKQLIEKIDKFVA